jgi:hypothetical protein
VSIQSSGYKADLLNSQAEEELKQIQSCFSFAIMHWVATID